MPPRTRVLVSLVCQRARAGVPRLSTRAGWCPSFVNAIQVGEFLFGKARRAAAEAANKASEAKNAAVEKMEQAKAAAQEVASAASAAAHLATAHRSKDEGGDVELEGAHGEEEEEEVEEEEKDPEVTSTNEGQGISTGIILYISIYFSSRRLAGSGGGHRGRALHEQAREQERCELGAHE